MSFQVVDKDSPDRFAVEKNWLRFPCGNLAIVCSASGAPQLKTTVADSKGNQACAPMAKPPETQID